MAIPAAAVWEVRSATGSDNNGGFYSSGGTDYSQQDAAQLTLTDVVTNGTTTVTSATGGFTAAMIGNGINIAGTIYHITARTNTNTITIDRTASAASGQTANVGGALATISKLNSNMVAGNKAFIKGTGFTTTATLTFAQSTTPDGATPPTRLIGYGTTRGDSARAKLTLSTNSSLTGIVSSGNGFWIENIEVDCASLTSSTGLSTTGSWARVRNCKITNFTLRGIRSAGNNGFVHGCEVTSGTSAATAGVEIVSGEGVEISLCYIYGNACTGIITTNNQRIIRNIIAGNTGASSDGIRTAYGCTILNNTIHNNGRHGINYTQAFTITNHWLGNLITNNGGWGILGSNGTAMFADPVFDGNAFYSNTSGTRSLMDNVTGIHAVAPYTNTRDVTLSASPYVDAASGNFALNSTAGGGAACKGVAVPGAFVGGLSTGYLDMGAVQSQASAGSSGGAVRGIYTGGRL